LSEKLISPIRSLSQNPPLGFLLFALFLVLYSYHAAPDVTWGDSGEFAAVAATLGIAHPTGYPLYTMVGKVLTLIPFATPARTLNLFSAACSALTLWVLYRATLLLLAAWAAPKEAANAQGRPGMPAGLRQGLALFGAYTLGICPVFISQAVITEVYALTNLFQALLWYLLLRWWLEGGKLKHFFFVLGLSLAHHLTMLLFVPFFLLLMLSGFRLSGRSEKALPPALLFALPGLALYLYLPLRAAMEPALNWGDPSNLKNFLWLVQGGDFRGFLLFDPLLQHGVEYVGYLIRAHVLRLIEQFSGVWLLALIAGIGAIYVWTKGGGFRRRATPAALMFLAFLFGSAYFSFYAVADQEVFFVMTYPLVAMLSAVGLGLVIEGIGFVSRVRKRPLPLAPSREGRGDKVLPPPVAAEKRGGKRPLPLAPSREGRGDEALPPPVAGEGRGGGDALRPLPAVVLAAVFLILLPFALRSFQQSSAREDIGAKVFGEKIIEALPPGSLLLVGLHGGSCDNEIYPLWYQKWALGRGEDVVIVAANFFLSPWYRFQLPETGVWFPSREDLQAAGLLKEVELPYQRTVYGDEALVLFLQRNEPLRPLYTLSWIPAFDPHFERERVTEVPILPGSVPEYYKRLLPGDGRLFRLRPKRPA